MKAKSQEGKKTSFVQFKEDIQEIQSDDESVESGKRSLAELWDISQALKTDDDELHPVTVITLTDKNGERLAASILIDYCCTGNGIITWDLSDALGFEMTEVANPQKYKTAGGDFESKYEINVKDAILPCLSTNRTFNSSFDVLPKERESKYAIIMGQRTMRKLGINTDGEYHRVGRENYPHGSKRLLDQ